MRNTPRPLPLQPDTEALLAGLLQTMLQTVVTASLQRFDSLVRPLPHGWMPKALCTWLAAQYCTPLKQEQLHPAAPSKFIISQTELHS
jgi:hypothetical protein